MRNRCEWYAVYHWVEDYPWREKRGNTPIIPRYAYWMNRYVAGWLIKHFADHILAVSDQTKEKLVAIKKIQPERIKAVYCGVEYEQIRGIVKKHTRQKGKTYDAVFMKRLNYGKGVLDLLKIWEGVVESKPDARLAVIGDGSPDVLEKVHDFIRSKNLESNIDILGVIYDLERKFEILNSSKIFLLPTHEENWAIVIGEAMAAGVPIIASRLKEIVPIWGDHVQWCDPGDVPAFIESVLGLLDNPQKARIIEKEALLFITKYDWQQIAHNEFLS